MFDKAIAYATGIQLKVFLPGKVIHHFFDFLLLLRQNVLFQALGDTRDLLLACFVLMLDDLSHLYRKSLDDLLLLWRLNILW